uniref:Uncharacterized protein n=1 Tax=Anguilla anguilla TaxID=7936 RepID=A0A0E9U2Z2_ANGAN
MDMRGKRILLKETTHLEMDGFWFCKYFCS